jgi:nucleoside-diphosphate-sugar epimerase
MYDVKYLDRMTEETPINPISEKGKVRAEVAQLVLDGISSGKITALIARSSDFFGPNIKNTSILTENVFKLFEKGKKAYWLGSVAYKHSYTYTPEAATATALLGNTEDAYNQVWHLPIADETLTGKEIIECIAKEMEVKPKFRILSKSFLSVMGVFIPIMKEVKEMYYLYESDYIFDSSKFNKRFNYTPITFQEGIKKIVKANYKKN